MSALGDAVEKLFTGGVGRPAFGQLLAAYEAEKGSGRKAARSLGIAESTWRRWKKGATPKAVNLNVFEQASRELRARHLTNDQIKIRTVEESDARNLRRERHRELGARHLRFDEGAADAIRAAYVEGGPEAAAAQLLEQTRVPFYRTLLGGRNIADPDDQGAQVASDYGAAVLA